MGGKKHFRLSSSSHVHNSTTFASSMYSGQTTIVVISMGPKFYSETKVSPLVCLCQLSIFLQVTFLLSTPFCLTSPVFRVIYCRTIVTSPRSNDTVMISELKPVTLELLLYGLSGSPDWNPERRVASGEADVSTSRPMNRILCEDFSTITYMKG